MFSDVHEQLSASQDPQVNRAGIFLRLLEINKRVEQLFDQSEVGLGPNQADALPLPGGPVNGEAPSEPTKGSSQAEGLVRFRQQIMGLDARVHQRKFADMNDVVDMHSDKALPDFLHKLNLRLNLYEPDLKFATVSKKWA